MMPGIGGGRSRTAAGGAHCLTGCCGCRLWPTITTRRTRSMSASTPNTPICRIRGVDRAMAADLLLLRIPDQEAWAAPLSTAPRRSPRWAIRSSGVGTHRRPRRSGRLDHPPRRPRRRHPGRTRRHLAAVVHLPGPHHLHLLHNRHGALRRPRVHLLPHPHMGPGAHASDCDRYFIDRNLSDIHSRRRPPSPQTTWPPLRPAVALRSWPLFGRRMAVGLILVAAIMAFAYFWPVYTGEVIRSKRGTTACGTSPGASTSTPPRVTKPATDHLDTHPPRSRRLGDIARSPQGHMPSLASNHCRCQSTLTPQRPPIAWPQRR